MNEEKNQQKTIRFEPEPSNTGRKLNSNSSIQKVNNRQKSLKFIIIPIAVVLLITLGIGLYFGLRPDHSKVPIPTPPSDLVIIPPTDPKIPDYLKQNGPLEMQQEYKLKTEPNDLKRIYINQKYYEDIKVNGVLSKTIVDRKTNYDIYIIDKINATGEEKYFYNYTYYCAIAISSECTSSKDEYCTPRTLVDLNMKDKSTLRNLKEIDTLEDFPIPLCFFNLTDNNVITSISCHKNISESKVNKIVLDLYFYRPPGIKRLSERSKINSEKLGNNTVIRETNDGICDIYNPIESTCTTDMNTTKDSEGNLISYDEYTYTRIPTDKDNYYIKKKYTYLTDKTGYSPELNPEKYNETLNKIYPHLKNYLKTYEQFSRENFCELYNVSKGLPDIKEQNRRRRLNQQGSVIEKNINYLKLSHYGGVNIQLSLKNNIGYNTQNMFASNIMSIDDKTDELIKIKEPTDMDRVIKKLISLSKAGNNLATALYNAIKENLNNITQVIDINIPNMSTLLAYKELSDVIDSTFSLQNLKVIPYKIIEESDYLKNKFDELYNGIDNGSLKSHTRILNDYIYEYIKQSHMLVNKISNNLKELGNLMKSPKQTISDISSYYMNHTTVSYVNAIKEAKNILLNYYKNETFIIPTVQGILEKFENVTLDSIKKQMKLINNLNNLLENKNLSIENTTEEEYKKLISNLHNSNDYINNIIDLFKQKVENEMDLKNGYFISQYDIDSNNEEFTRIINESLEIAQKLDDNEYVDKLFDEIMTNFRQTFIDITKDMEQQRELQFITNENSLLGGYFKISEQKDISEDLKELGSDIIIKIINENNLYLDEMNNAVNEFLKKNKERLNQLMIEINILFSTESLNKIAKSYHESLNRLFNELRNDIQKNKNLSYEYMDSMANLMTNNNAIVKLLQTYTEKNQYEEYNYMCKTEDTINEIHCYNNTFFTDSIKSRKKGKDYKKKYELYIQKFEKSKDFLKSDLYSNILNEYKKILALLKETLQSFKNNKMSNVYQNYERLEFIDTHINNINDLYGRMNRYISDNIFNNNYYPIIQDFNMKEINKINEIILHIEKQNKKIDVGDTGEKDDFCSNFERKRVFTCRNGNVHYPNTTQDICIGSWGTNNLKYMKELSYHSDEIFEYEFYNFNSSIKNRIDEYNSLISELKEKMKAVEKRILSEKITNNYFSQIENKISLILSEKYSDNLIQGSYEYYKNILNDRLENVLSDTSNKWISSFENLRENVDSNLNNFTHSMNEIGVMALIYENVISQNLTSIFYDSIIKHQKSEFNYTISYYYNCLIQNLTSVYQYVYNQIPTNEEGFNNIINLRKKEVDEKFKELLKIVTDSKSESLSNARQVYVLQTSSSNFFKTNSILSKNVDETSKILKNKGNTIYRLKNGKRNNEFSLACRFYLENSLNGLQIEEYFEPINENNNLFIILNTNKFLELLSDNWIFDQDDFINQLNNSIKNSTLEIKNDFLIKKENYSKLLENEIIKFEYSKENISQKISDKYKDQIKEIDEEKKNKINKNIQELLNLIKTHLESEKERILKFSVSYTNNISKINNTYNSYKGKIIENLEKIILKIVNDLNEELALEGYTKNIELGLNEYLNNAQEYISECKTFDTLNSSYNIGEIIYENVKLFVEEYKNHTKMQLEYTQTEYISKLKKEIEIDKIKKLIDEELDPIYGEFLDALKNISGDISSGTIGYTDYDLSNDIKNDISTKNDNIFININNIFNQIKVDKLELIGWEILPGGFDSVKINTFKIINKDFEDFMNNKIKAEKINTDTFLKNIIKANFNNLINNFIFTFGNEYFERMIKYNENFKISSLYQNLKYSLVISLNYYQMLYQLKKDINSLTQDLKIKLYNLNNLDKIAEEKNKKVLNMLIEKSDEFIENSKQQILRDYKLYLTSDTSIQLAYNSRIIKSIDNNLKDVSNELEKDFSSLLTEQFKDKFINSYTKTMKEQTKDLIQTVNELKQKVKSLFDDFFSLDIEKVLNETNEQMNITLNSIEEYKIHFDSFKIPQELIDYCLNYGKEIIKPYYERFESLINKETRTLTLNRIDKNCDEFEKTFNSLEILNQIDKVNSSSKINIDNSYKEINGYGITEYPKILENEINKIEARNLRRLNDEQTEEDENEEHRERIADKSIDENFHKLLELSKNTKRYIENYEYFDTFIDKIMDNKKKLSLSHKESLLIINDSFEEEEEIKEFLIDKIQNLNNLSLQYYNEIEDNFSSLKNYIQNSLKEIDNLLNQCFNITYETFAYKYENYSRLANPIDKPYNEVVKNIPMKIYTTSTQFGEFVTEATIKALIKKANFKFNLILEGEEGKIKKPKIIAIVNNEIKPQQIKFKIDSTFGNCGEEYQTFDILEISKINYTIILNFDTESNLINYTTITDFDKINYQVARYKIEDSEIDACANTIGLGLCLEECDDYNIITIQEPTWGYSPKINRTEPGFLFE